MAFVNCEFKLKDSSRVVPYQVLADLFEVVQYLNEYNGYNVGYGRGSFYFGIWERYLPLGEDLPEVLAKGVLGERHYQSFLWLKENTIYTGDSKNVNDWDRHPDDFFEDVEDIIKDYKEEQSNGYKTGST